jgi:hypothetical protein
MLIQVMPSNEQIGAQRAGEHHGDGRVARKKEETSEVRHLYISEKQTNKYQYTTTTTNMTQSWSSPAACTFKFLSEKL